MSAPAPLSQRSILLFWAPLAATWLMMAVEGPFLAAVIARLAEAKINLAAYGVAFAIAMLVESPVVMLMTTSTALAEDAHSFRKLRRFAMALNAATTGVLFLVLVPPVFDLIALKALALPEEVAALTRDALWLLIPWPAAIGYRRFYQGLLIRDGRPRLVAAGTVTRISAIALVALVLARLGFQGIHVAAAAMTAGVCTEAAASRWMARGAVARVLGRSPGGGREAIDYPLIARFYYPLALTSLLGFAATPLLTFFMSRAPAPVESLAVFPVVGSLTFVFRAVCLAYQEVTIALLGDRNEQLPALRRFSVSLGLVTTAGLAVFGLTPFSGVWFGTISGLTPELAAFAILPTVLFIPLPFLSAMLSLERGLLIKARRTRPVTLATATEVVCMAAGFPLLVDAFGWVGVTAAAGASLAGRTVAVSILVAPVVRVIGAARPISGESRSFRRN